MCKVETPLYVAYIFNFFHQIDCIDEFVIIALHKTLFCLGYRTEFRDTTTTTSKSGRSVNDVAHQRASNRGSAYNLGPSYTLITHASASFVTVHSKLYYFSFLIVIWIAGILT